MIIVRRTRPRDLERVQQEMEDVFRALIPGRPSGPSVGGRLWRPPVEVYETDDALVIQAEIAGMNEENLNVVLDGSVLSIRGERPDQCQADRRSFHEARIPYGAFGVDVFVPFAVDTDGTTAQYHNGFLCIVLPRVAPRTILPRQVDGSIAR